MISSNIDPLPFCIKNYKIIILLSANLVKSFLNKKL
nr:MAG TPA: hypothetical protein [Caudoviricetes sp.]